MKMSEQNAIEFNKHQCKRTHMRLTCIRFSLPFPIIMMKIFVRHFNKQENKMHSTIPYNSLFPIDVRMLNIFDEFSVPFFPFFLFYPLFSQSEIHCVLAFDMVSFQFEYFSLDNAFFFVGSLLSTFCDSLP